MKDFYKFICEVLENPVSLIFSFTILICAITFPAFWYTAIVGKAAIEAGLVEIPNIGSSGTHWGKPTDAKVEK